MTISSPCIALCVLDEDAGFCLGCGRTRAEIAGWMAMSEEARLALMRALPARLAGRTKPSAARVLHDAVGRD